MQRLARGSLATIGLGLLAGCDFRSSPAPPAPKMPRVGWLSASGPESGLVGGFQQELAGRGYAKGRDYALEARFADGDTARLPALAAELIRLPVDVLVAHGQFAALSAQQATTTIPIVFIDVADPIGLRLVGSLARPVGSMIGRANMGRATMPKILELLAEIAPAVRRPAALWNGGITAMTRFWEETLEAAQTLRLDVVPHALLRAADVDVALAAAADEAADALIVISDSLLEAQETKILAFAADRRLPLVSQRPDWAFGGGLLSFVGGSTGFEVRSAAGYVDKILKGAKPADLPVEQPTRFQLVVNLKAASALGLTVPHSILARATEVIR